MNIHQLNYFLDLASTLSFTQTARNFFVSQTAITQQIKSLEEKLGVQLFERTKRRVELTPAGHVFIGEARSIIAKIESSIAKTRAASSGFSGTLSLAFIAGFGQTPFPQFLHTFQHQYPNIDLKISNDSISGMYNGLRSGIYDIVFNLAFDLDKQSLPPETFLELETYPLYIVIPPDHPLAGAPSLTWGQIKNETFVHYDLIDSLNLTNMPGLKDPLKSGQFKSVQRQNNFETILLLVSIGMGITLLPEFFRNLITNTMNLVFIPLAGGKNHISIIANWSPGDTNPSRQKMVAALKEFCQDN